MGAMKMKITRDDIAAVISTVRSADSPVKAARARGISVSLENEGQNAPSEINVIGYNVDDATREVQKFVDRAFLAGLPRVPHSPRQRHGHPAQSPAPGPAAASPRGVSRRASAERRWRRGYGGGVASVAPAGGENYVMLERRGSPLGQHLLGPHTGGAAKPRKDHRERNLRW